MRNYITLAAVAALLALAGASRAQTGAMWTLENDSFTAGDPTFPVTTNVTFTSVNLVETFADSTTAQVALHAPDGTVKTSLTTTDTFLRSDPVDLSLHGGVSSATLTGAYSTTTWKIASVFLGPKTTVSVLQGISDTINNPTKNSSSFLLGVNSVNGTQYKVGQLYTTPAALPSTPEPGTLAILVSAGLAGAWWRRQRTT